MKTRPAVCHCHHQVNIVRVDGMLQLVAEDSGKHYRLRVHGIQQGEASSSARSFLPGFLSAFERLGAASGEPMASGVDVRIWQTKTRPPNSLAIAAAWGKALVEASEKSVAKSTFLSFMVGFTSVSATAVVIMYLLLLNK